MRRVIIVVLFLALCQGHHGQQKYPFGAYLICDTTYTRFNNYQQVTDLGVNFVVQNLSSASRTAMQNAGLKYIALNADNADDLVHFFSAGNYVKYKPCAGTEYTERLTFNPDRGELVGGAWKVGVGDYSPGELILNGPNSTQQVKYNVNYYYYFVPYLLNLNLKITGDTTEHTPVLTVYIKYNRPGDSLVTICSTVLYADELHTYFSDLTNPISYNLAALPRSADSVFSSPIGPRISATPDQSYTENELLTGIHYRIYWHGTRTTYLKYVEVYDAPVYRDKYLLNPNEFVENLDYYTNIGDNDPNLMYWHTVGEPHCLDNYYPLKLLGEIHTQIGAKAPTTLFYPEYNNYRNGNNTFKQYKDSANPAQLLYYYFPFWTTDVFNAYSDTLGVVFYFLGQSFHDAYNNFGPFYYSAQAEGFRHDATTYLWRKPEGEELTATLFYALAAGAKGIILENFYSYPRKNEADSNFFFRCDGLVYNTTTNPVTFTPTPLYTYLKDHFKQRITGILGDTIKSLRYTQAYIKKRRGDYFAESPSTRIDSVINGAASTRMHMYASDKSPNQNHIFHIGFFADPVDSQYVKWFMLVNLQAKKWDSAGSLRYVDLNFRAPDTLLYRNYRLYNIEGGYDTTFSAQLAATIPIHGGDGILFRVAPVVRSGGKLVVNDTINSPTLLTDKVLTIGSGVSLIVNDDFTLKKDIVVETGGALIINEGVTLSLLNGAKLVIHGTIDAEGTENDPVAITFQQSESEDPTGIFLSEGSSGTFQHVNIQYATRGIQADSSLLFVNYCDISNCVEGINLKNNHYYPDIDEGTKIWNSHIQDNQSVGITLDNSSPLLVGNDIEHNPVGISCVNLSTPYLGNKQDVGMNNLEGTTYALYAHSSSPVLGITDGITFAGYNSVIGGEQYDVYIEENSYVDAEQCWWGENPPADSQFYTNNSRLNYDNYLSSNPFSQRIAMGNSLNADAVAIPAAKDDPVQPLSHKYRAALRNYMHGNLTAAGQLAKELIAQNPDTLYAFAAFALLERCSRTMTSRDSFRVYAHEIGNSSSHENIRVLAKLYLANNRSRNYPSSIDSIIQRYPANSQIALLLYEKCLWYYFTANRRDSAVAVLQTMRQIYPDAVLTNMASNILNPHPLQKSAPKGKQELKNEQVFSLSSYPNPFNPVARLRCCIRTTGEVRLSIFNVIGEEVAVLVNEIREAGEHDLSFNGAAYPSGIYFARLWTNDGVKIQKMILVK